MKQTQLGLMFIAALMTGTAYAQDLTGIWQQIDDKTGSPKAIIEIRQNDNGTFPGKIIKVISTVQAILHKRPAINVPRLLPISRSWGILMY